MMTRGLVATVIGMFFAWGLNTFALAADGSIGFAAPAVAANELGQIRAGMTKADLIEGIIARVDEVRRGINKPDLVEGLTGVPEAVSGIREALVTTAGGLKERLGQIAAGVRSARSSALQQGRVLLDSD